MSFIINNEIKFSDSPNIDSFGRLRVSEPQTLFSFSQTQTSGVTIMETYVSGGTVTFNKSSSETQFNVTANGHRVIREQHGYNIYQPGKSQLIFLTGIFGTPTTNVTKRIGYYNDSNGLFFTQTGGTGTFGVTLRTSTSGSVVDIFVPQDQWNLDTLNTGSTLNPSGIHLDVTKTNIFLISFQWLGVGRVVFGLDLNGIILPVHEILNANNKTSVYMETANLPVRYEVTSQGGSDSTFKQICASVISEGGQEENGFTTAISNNLNTRTFSTEQAVLSVRLSTTLQGKTNRISILPLAVDILTTTTTVNAEWKLIIQRGFIGENNLGGSPTWNTWSSTTEGSILQYSVNGTTVTGGTILDSGFVSSSNQSGSRTVSSIIKSKDFLSLNMSGNTSDWLHLVINPSVSSSWSGKISLLSKY